MAGEHGWQGAGELRQRNETIITYWYFMSRITFKCFESYGIAGLEVRGSRFEVRNEKSESTNKGVTGNPDERRGEMFPGDARRSEEFPTVCKEQDRKGPPRAALER